MKTSIHLMLLASILTGSAQAEIRTIVEAKETSPAYMTVPTTDNARLIFKTCEECDYISVRLTPETQYFVGGVPHSFAEFRHEFQKLQRSKDDYALVSFYTQTNTVKSVRIIPNPDQGSIERG